MKLEPGLVEWAKRQLSLELETKLIGLDELAFDAIKPAMSAYDRNYWGYVAQLQVKCPAPSEGEVAWLNDIAWEWACDYARQWHPYVFERWDGEATGKPN